MAKNVGQRAFFINGESGVEVMVSETPERNYIKLRVANGQQWAMTLLSKEAWKTLCDTQYSLEVNEVTVPEEGDEF